jgi:hypothetical protein
VLVQRKPKGADLGGFTTLRSVVALSLEPPRAAGAVQTATLGSSSLGSTDRKRLRSYIQELVRYGGSIHFVVPRSFVGSHERPTDGLNLPRCRIYSRRRRLSFLSYEEIHLPPSSQHLSQGLTKPLQVYPLRIVCELRLPVSRDQAVWKIAVLSPRLIVVFQTSGSQDIHKRCFS